MREIIVVVLKKVEEDYDVKVLYVCESGSRVWDFLFKDSDYDVRFIYIYKRNKYLSIDLMGVGKKWDVIELFINGLLDVSGWDLIKILKFFRKLNLFLLEWM